MGRHAARQTFASPNSSTRLGLICGTCSTRIFLAVCFYGNRVAIRRQNPRTANWSEDWPCTQNAASISTACSHSGRRTRRGGHRRSGRFSRRPRNPAWLVAERDGVILDNALERIGLPQCGFRYHTRFRGATQVLKLCLAFMWAPVNPHRMLQILLHPTRPYAPVGAFASRRCRRCILQGGWS